MNGEILCPTIPAHLHTLLAVETDTNTLADPVPLGGGGRGQLGEGSYTYQGTPKLKTPRIGIAHYFWGDGPKFTFEKT